MNARRRTKPDGLPSRVYIRYGSYHWVRNTDEKWIKLCRVDDGETRMLERLAEEKRKTEVDSDEGTMSRLVKIYMEQQANQYAESFRKEWRRRGEDVRKAFKQHGIEEVDPGAVQDFLLGNWPDKLPTQNAMKGWLSKFFSWAVLRRHITINPCREVELKKPKVRKVYMSNADFLAIRAALATYTYKKRVRGVVTEITAKVPTGPEMQVFVDLCYLMLQRSTEIRLLRLSQIDWQQRLIYFLPTKTEDSSGASVQIPLTKEIEAVLKRAKEIRGSIKVQSITDDYVILDRDGKPKTAQACLDAWNKAMTRAKLGHKDYTVKDILAKAMTDAKNAGYDIEALQVARAHADRATTEDYIKQRETPLSTVRMRLPAS